MLSVRVRLICVFASIALVGFALVISNWIWNKYDYRLQFSSGNCLIIRSVPSLRKGHRELLVTYHIPPAVGSYMVGKQEVKSDSGVFHFSKIVDENLIIVFDTQNAGYIFAYDKDSDDFWDTTGRSGGANGSDSSFWNAKLAEFARRHPEFPYRDTFNK